ncbi:hypothetical protein HNY73_004123 [Argiope bruennichi]|uniref:Uncharacterized protein n=1 Tax=Argiope bruennichi TaxID=94029 RepID=A0A8T0FS77_ARGBR|nr:hypothetical protein HNY73_004123 [Argiope bruennichi]
MFSPDEIGPTMTEYIGGFPPASNEALKRCKKRISTHGTNDLLLNRFCDETNKDADVHLPGSDTSSTASTDQKWSTKICTGSQERSTWYDTGRRQVGHYLPREFCTKPRTDDTVSHDFSYG